MKSPSTHLPIQRKIGSFLILTPLALLLATLFVAGCRRDNGAYFGQIKTRKDTRTLYFANSAEPEFMDPQRLTATNDKKVADQVFEGLLDSHPETALPIPGIAERWEASEDSIDFTFYLRKEARFSDGRQITAEDVIYTWSRILHPAWACTDAEEAYKIEGGEEYNGGRLFWLKSAAGPLRPGRVKLVEDARYKGDGEISKRVAKRSLALLRAPSSDAPVTTRLPSGRALIAYDQTEQGDWVHVWDDETLVGGWVLASDLSQPSSEKIFVVEGFDVNQRGIRAFVPGRELVSTPRVLSLRAESPQVLKVHLAKPTLFWLLLTANATFRIVDQYSIERLGREWHRRAGKYAGSGPFRLTEWKLRDHLTLEKNPHYWGAKEMQIDKIVVYSIEKQSTAAALYATGNVDVLTANNFPNSMLPTVNGSLGDAPKLDYFKIPYLGTYFYVLNVDKKNGPPALKNLHLRRALAMSLDRAQLPGLLKSGVIPWTALVPFGMEPFTGYKSPPGLAFNLTKAREELALAKKELGSIPAMTIRINTGVEQHQIIAEWVQGEWTTNLGLSIRIEAQEWKTMLKDMRAHKFEILRMGGISSMPEPEDSVGDEYRIGSVNNKPGWESPEYMVLLEKMQHEPIRAKRNQYIYQMENLILEDAVIIPLYTYVQHVFAKPYVCGLARNSLDQVALKYVWIDFSRKCDAANRGGAQTAQIVQPAGDKP